MSSRVVWLPPLYCPRTWSQHRLSYLMLANSNRYVVRYSQNTRTMIPLMRLVLGRCIVGSDQCHGDRRDRLRQYEGCEFAVYLKYQSLLLTK
ncbi:hypothetical protein K449DRAFT_33820 [Hypoxylon sp. EC38]|nr:hypothetical protein K449DRAFT_33820 [Hypoxylon sp. EC38]